jgi:hypothetical protein
MRWTVMASGALLSLLFMCGCQENRPRERTLMLSSSVSDLYYRQVLNNLAMLHGNPGAIPYFSIPIQGVNQNQMCVSKIIEAKSAVPERDRSGDQENSPRRA